MQNPFFKFKIIVLCCVSHADPNINRLHNMSKLCENIDWLSFNIVFILKTLIQKLNLDRIESV